MLDKAIEAGIKVLDKVFPDADAEAKRQAAVQLAQIEVNKEEAKHASIFVAGWRPAVGWICASGLLYATMIEPVLKYIAFLNDYDLGGFEGVGIGILMPVLMGMLGMGYYRWKEKESGVARSNMKEN